METEQETPLQGLRRRDFVTALVLLGFCIVVFIESARLTFAIPASEQSLLTTPGIVPLFISSSLILMLTAIIVLSWRDGRFSGLFSSSAIISSLRTQDVLLKISHAGLLLVYVFLALGRVHFALATAAYLFAAMAISEDTKPWQCAPLATVISGAVYVVFGVFMKVPLP